MNKKKVEKLLNDNLKIENNFENINKNIDYSKYEKKFQKKSNIFYNFFLNKKVMAIATSLVIFIIAIPLLIEGISITKLNSSSMENNKISSIQNNNTVPQNSESSEPQNSEIVNTHSSVENSMIVSSEVTISSATSSFEYIDVYGIIKNDDNNLICFYTDETFGYVDDNYKSQEFNQTGYYDLGDLYILGYIMNEGILEESDDKNAKIYCQDLPIGTSCIGSIVTSSNDPNNPIGSLIRIELS